MSSSIKDAIASAIAFYSNERFWFNELTTMFNTQPNVRFYGATEGVPADIAEIDSVTMTINGRNYPLDSKTFNELDEIDVGGNMWAGYPMFYAYYGQKFRFYPAPRGVYPVNLSYKREIAVPVDDTDSNAWTNEAEALIRTCAKKYLFRDVLYVTDKAAMMQSAETIELAGLKSKTNELAATNKIRGDF
jgi:hypothetical protein